MRLALALLFLSATANAWLPMPKNTWDGCEALKEENYTLGKVFAKALHTERIEVVRIADSKRNTFGGVLRQACWVETSLGILEVMFFPGDTTPVKIEKAPPVDGMAITRVTLPEGKTVEMQGLDVFSFAGPHSWVTTSDAKLGKVLARIKDFP